MSRRLPDTAISKIEDWLLRGGFPDFESFQRALEAALSVIEAATVPAHNELTGKYGDADYYHLDASAYGHADAMDQDVASDDSVLFADVTVGNSGLHVLDTNASHDLIITPGSDLSADRVLTLTTGDAARTITLNGNPTLDDWFDQAVKAASTPTFDGVILEGGTHDTTLDAGTPTEAVTYTWPAADGNAGELMVTDGSGALGWVAAGGVADGVAGPGSSTDHAVVRWDGAGGDTLQDSVGILTDAGALTVKHLYLDGAANPTIYLREGGDASNYTQLMDASDNVMTLDKIVAASFARMQINPSPGDGTSEASLFLLRATSTTGTRQVNIYKGDGSATITAQINAALGTLSLEGDILPLTAAGTDLGSASKELGDIYVATDKRIKLGNGQEAFIEFDSGTSAVRIVVL